MISLRFLHIARTEALHRRRQQLISISQATPPTRTIAKAVSSSTNKPPSRHPATVKQQASPLRKQTRPHTSAAYPNPAARASFTSTSFSMSASTMPAQHGHSQACCNIPPVVSEGYQEKGAYDEVDGLKTCMLTSLSYPWQVMRHGSIPLIPRQTSPALPMPKRASSSFTTSLASFRRPFRAPTSFPAAASKITVS